MFECQFEIELNGVKRTEYVTAPRIFLEDRFLQAVDIANRSRVPMKVTMRVKVPIWCQYDGAWIERENTIVAVNNAYERMYPGWEDNT